MNVICLTGRMVETPELKHTPSNKTVTSFKLAVTRDFKVNGEKVTDFLDVVVWNKQAEFASSYFKKGQMVSVSGALQVRNYEDKQGNKRTAYEVNAEKLGFCESKKSGNKADVDNSEPANVNSGDFEEIDDPSDLPF